MRERKSHVWEKDEDGWYVEPSWCSRRLFEEEDFQYVYDPSCGIGTIPEAAQAMGLTAFGSDIVQRKKSFPFPFEKADFLKRTKPIAGDVVCNPPFDHVQAFCEKALELGAGKVAMITLVRRLNAARWLQTLPLASVYLLTPRPSMPPGSWIAQGNKPGGGTQDFCWLVFDRHNANVAAAELLWLHRDAS